MSDLPRSVGDLLAAGRAALAPDLADHVAAGAGDESTIAANRTAIERVHLVPRVAAGVGAVSTATEFLGVSVNAPLLTAPMGPMELIDGGGAAAVAAAALRAGVVSVAAVTSSPVLEELGAASGPMLFQLYWWGDRDWLSSMLDRIVGAGFRGVVVTVDVPDYGSRWRDIRSGFDHHGQMALPNLADAPPTRAERLAHQAELSWDGLAWFCETSPIPVVIKGVLDAGDAERSVAVGARGVYVSNHGGRALAGQLGAMDAVADIVDAVAGRAGVIVDGGFSTAEDIVKALALGADMVGLGRAIAWALAAGGAVGVEAYLGLLEDDLRVALTVLGASTIADLGRHHVRRV